MVDARPLTKTLLPFRLSRDSEGIIAECDGLYPDGQKCPQQVRIGDPESPMTALYYPVGKGIFDLMQLYYALETKMEKLLQERDTLSGRVTELEGQLKSSQAAVREFERRRSDRKS